MKRLNVIVLTGVLMISSTSCVTKKKFLLAENGRIEALSSIIRKSKFPWFPERSVQFSGKRTKRSVQKKGCTQHL